MAVPKVRTATVASAATLRLSQRGNQSIEGGALGMLDGSLIITGCFVATWKEAASFFKERLQFVGSLFIGGDDLCRRPAVGALNGV